MPTKYYETQNTGNADPFATLMQTDMSTQAKHLHAAQSSILLRDLKPPAIVGDGSGKWTADDINAAMRDIYDLTEKTMIHFLMLGDAARAIRDKAASFETKAIEFGFPVRQLTAEIKSLFKTWNFTPTDYGYTYNFTPILKWDIKIPVKIYIFKKDYSFFNNPDIGWYGVDDYAIANPFEEYWKVRDQVTKGGTK